MKIPKRKRRFIVKKLLPAVLVCMVFSLVTEAHSLRGSLWDSGYRIITEGGYSLGRGTDAPDDFNFTLSNGFYLSGFPPLYLGAGTGIVCYTEWQIVIIPVFAHARINLREGKAMPFFDYRIGYSAGDYGGLYVSPALGIKFRILPLCSVYLSAAYTLQRLFESYYDDYGNYDGRVFIDNLQSVNFRIGFEF